jgi:hypothetical protein
VSDNPVDLPARVAVLDVIAATTQEIAEIRAGSRRLASHLWAEGRSGLQPLLVIMLSGYLGLLGVMAQWFHRFCPGARGGTAPRHAAPCVSTVCNRATRSRRHGVRPRSTPLSWTISAIESSCR